MKAKIICLALLLILIPTAQAAALDKFDDITVYRVAPDQAFIGQKIWVVIVLDNNASVEKEITVNETLRNADFDKTEAKYIETEYKEKIWYYYWKVKLPAKENVTLAYWLIPKNSGTLVISPAEVNASGKSNFTKSLSIEVKCQVDGKCNLNAGENYLNCPEDCTTGAHDGICDGVTDGRCDPDCERSADVDCEKATPAATKPAPGFELIYALIAIATLLRRGVI